MKCPQTGRNLRGWLPVYLDGNEICRVSAEEAVSGLSGGMYQGAGSKRSVSCLLLLKRPDNEFRGPLPTQPPTSIREHVGDSYVWQHSHRALQWGMA